MNENDFLKLDTAKMTKIVLIALLALLIGTLLPATTLGEEQNRTIYYFLEIHIQTKDVTTGTVELLPEYKVTIFAYEDQEPFYKWDEIVAEKTDLDGRILFILPTGNYCIMGPLSSSSSSAPIVTLNRIMLDRDTQQNYTIEINALGLSSANLTPLYPWIGTTIFIALTTAAYLIKKKKTGRRTDIGPRLTKHQSIGLTIFIAGFWVGLFLFFNELTRLVPEGNPTPAEWIHSNLHLTFYIALLVILLIGTIKMATTQGAIKCRGE